MNIVALMAWYDEEPVTLQRAIRSAANAGVTHLVAVDGSYAMIPNPSGYSPIEQSNAIRQAASVCGVILDLTDGRVWPNEIEKRDYMFRRGDEHAGPDDWLYIMDADFETRGNFRRELRLAFHPDNFQGTSELVCNAHLRTPDGPMKNLRYGVAPSMMFRCLYRGGQEIRVTGNHYTYVAKDGARLWGSALGLPPLQVPTTLEGLEIVHWTYFRDPERVARQISYYQERDRTGIERGPCRTCGVVSTSFVPIITGDDDDQITTRFGEFCDQHAGPALVEQRKEFARLGGDNPALLKIMKPA